MRIATLVILSTLAAAAQAGEELRFHPVPGEARQALPFSDAVQVGHLLFLSGRVGIEPGTTRLVGGGIQAETRRIMEDIRATLERHGTSMDRVAKCTVFLADIGEWAAMNEVYVEFFPGPRPARSALGASGLALGARVEIECIAALAD